jgi:uncharacterized protein YdgA (DUF945 family)
MKQTAVEWLYSEWAKNGTIFLEDLEQAKEMEKKQIIESVDYCLASVKISDDKTVFTATTAEQYYNETYEAKED